LHVVGGPPQVRGALPEFRTRLALGSPRPSSMAGTAFVRFHTGDSITYPDAFG
jgi:hypothetical protein